MLVFNMFSEWISGLGYKSTNITRHSRASNVPRLNVSLQVYHLSKVFSTRAADAPTFCFINHLQDDLLWKVKLGLHLNSKQVPDHEQLHGRFSHVALDKLCFSKLHCKLGMFEDPVYILVFVSVILFWMKCGSQTKKGYNLTNNKHQLPRRSVLFSRAACNWIYPWTRVHKLYT